VGHPCGEGVQSLAPGADDELADPVLGVDLPVGRLRGEARVQVVSRR